MTKFKLILIIATLSLTAACTDLSRSRDLSNPSASGVTLAHQVCSTCHGADGNSDSPQFPKLAGQQANYLKNQLLKFKDHSRYDRLAPEFMYGISHALTPKQVDELAEYFSGQNLRNQDIKQLADNHPGKIIFQNGIADRGIPPCQACHGESALGQYDYPRLAGQHKQYLIKQLHVFHENSGRPDTPMEVVTKSLTEKEIDQVASYLSSL